MEISNFSAIVKMLLAPKHLADNCFCHENLHARSEVKCESDQGYAIKLNIATSSKTIRIDAMQLGN